MPRILANFNVIYYLFKLHILFFFVFLCIVYYFVVRIINVIYKYLVLNKLIKLCHVWHNCFDLLQKYAYLLIIFVPRL